MVFMLQGKAPVFRHTSGKRTVEAESDADVQRALAVGVGPYIAENFQRSYEDEEDFLKLTRELLQRIFVAHKDRRLTLDTVNSLYLHFIDYIPEIQMNGSGPTSSPISEINDLPDLGPDGAKLVPDIVKLGEHGVERVLGSSCCYKYTSRVDKLGQGTYGSVFKAVITNPADVAGLTTVAVKEIFVQQIEDCGLSKSTLNAERWKHLLLLKHENIVRYHKISIFKTRNGTAIELVMDYIPGGDLAKYVASRRLAGNLARNFH
ncbi:uncharacterized protein LOC129596898 [Paramacrobiotus metropolitanus]|uniref:uncharacterized protein LOC129596898 n=1 Tax=Paramacrobiotus metropolitanus TaxID=2943436 RepID=UPI0024458C06|nr:uncharacterized protein LOC129596898 [Paramacrobiotus metropolitanus]